MENYTLLNKILTLAFATLLFIGCEPNEDKLEFNLEKQQVEKVFSFQDYCKEKYDSIFLVYPYFNTVHIDYTSLKMSNSLRGICNANINFDHFSTILFIKNGKVEAYSDLPICFESILFFIEEFCLCFNLLIIKSIGLPFCS